MEGSHRICGVQYPDVKAKKATFACDNEIHGSITSSLSSVNRCAHNMITKCFNL